MSLEFWLNCTANVMGGEREQQEPIGIVKETAGEAKAVQGWVQVACPRDCNNRIT